MSKTVTAIASVFVVAIVAVLVIQSGVLDSLFGEGESDVDYKIYNGFPGEVTLTFSDGINEEKEITVPSGETYEFSVHYKWDNKLPLVFTAKCQYTFMGLSYGPSKQMMVSNGETFTVDLDLADVTALV